MSDIRLFSDVVLAVGNSVELRGDRARYVNRVLRLRPNDRVTLFDGSGAEFPAAISTSRRDSVVISIDQRVDLDRESAFKIRLLQGISRGERMDFAVQKATELGVARITPVLTEYTVVKLDAGRAQKKRAHWQGVCISACEQCGRNVLPVIDVATGLRDWMGENPEDGEARIVLRPGGDASITDVVSGPGAVSVLVGPEGGLSDDEYELAAACGFRAVGFGPRILRTETAAVAVLAALQSLYGDLG
jgi:16S rRNA (uracil1498-N3)-methyltransferase